MPIEIHGKPGVSVLFSISANRVTLSRVNTFTFVQTTRFRTSAGQAIAGQRRALVGSRSRPEGRFPFPSLWLPDFQSVFNLHVSIEEGSNLIETVALISFEMPPNSVPSKVS